MRELITKNEQAVQLQILTTEINEHHQRAEFHAKFAVQHALAAGEKLMHYTQATYAK